MRTVGKDDDRAVTADPKRGIRQYFWAYDGKHLLYLQDADGDENFHLYAVNVETKETRDLTPFKGVRVQGVELDEKFPDQMLVGMNKRNKQLFDVHRINLSTGEDEARHREPRQRARLDDRRRLPGPRRAGHAARTAAQDLLARDKPDAEWKKIRSWAPEEQGGPAGFGPDGNTLYAHRQRWTRTRSGWSSSTWPPARPRSSPRTPRPTLGGALIDNRRRVPLAVAFTKARTSGRSSTSR